ncbi:MAG: two-component regulator propeller domain-containing protein [bacterium]
MRTIIWILFLLSATNPFLHSQVSPDNSIKTSDTSWTVFNTKNSGIPNDVIRDIAIDRNSNKWIATFGGLAKFDGKNWTVYNTSNSGIPSDTLSSVEVDFNQNIWITSLTNGFAKFDGKTWETFTTKDSPLPTSETWSIETDNDDNIWVCTSGKGIVRIAGKDWINYNTLNSKIENNYVTSIFVDQNDNKWFTPVNGGLILYKNNFWKVINSKNSKLPQDHIMSFYADDIGTFWMGTLPGVGLIKVADTTWTFYTEINSNIPISGVSSITQDYKRNIWFAAFNSDLEQYIPLGFVKFDGTNFIHYHKDNSPLPTNDITVIATEKNGNIWLGTNFEGLVLHKE